MRNDLVHYKLHYYTPINCSEMLSAAWQYLDETLQIQTRRLSTSIVRAFVFFCTRVRTAIKTHAGLNAGGERWKMEKQHCHSRGNTATAAQKTSHTRLFFDDVLM